MCVIAGAAAAGALGGLGSAMTAITSIASIGIGMMQANAQNQAAAAQYKNQVSYIQRQEVEAQKTLNLQVAEQRAQYNSDVEKAQGEKARTSIASYKAASRASAAAAESGVTGLSVDTLVGHIFGEGFAANAQTDRNAKVAHQMGSAQLKNAQRTGAARVRAMERPAKPKFNTGLQIGTAVLSGLTGLAGAF